MVPLYTNQNSSILPIYTAFILIWFAVFYTMSLQRPVSYMIFIHSFLILFICILHNWLLFDLTVDVYMLLSQDDDKLWLIKNYVKKGQHGISDFRCSWEHLLGSLFDPTSVYFFSYLCETEFLNLKKIKVSFICILPRQKW